MKKTMLLLALIEMLQTKTVMEVEIEKKEKELDVLTEAKDAVGEAIDEINKELEPLFPPGPPLSVCIDCPVKQFCGRFKV